MAPRPTRFNWNAWSRYSPSSAYRAVNDAASPPLKSDAQFLITADFNLCLFRGHTPKHPASMARLIWSNDEFFKTTITMHRSNQSDDCISKVCGTTQGTLQKLAAVRLITTITGLASPPNCFPTYPDAVGDGWALSDPIHPELKTRRTRQTVAESSRHGEVPPPC